MKRVMAVSGEILRQPGFAGLLVSVFALGIGYSFVAPFLSLWGTQELGMRPFAFGMYMTATTLSGIVVATGLARWSDTHLPRKVMILVAATGGVLGYAGYAFAHDPRILLAIGCTLLALSAMSFSQLFAYVREHFGETHIPGMPSRLLVSVVRVCFSVAWTAGPSVGAWMMVTHGFRGLFLGASGLFALYLFGIARCVRWHRRPPHVLAARREPVWRVLTRGDILAVFIAFLLIFAAHTLNMMNLPLAITGQLGGTGTDVGIAFGIGPLVEIPLMLWFGVLASRGHQLGLIRFGAGATVFYFLMLTFARHPWHVFVLQGLHGLSFAVIANVGIMFFQDLVPGQAGLATTIFSNASQLGNLVGFFAFGALVQPLGNRGLFCASAIFTAVTFAVIMAYRPRRPAPHHEAVSDQPAGPTFP
jgi:SET family sugar efflux transporter-like MFS transporter